MDTTCHDAARRRERAVLLTNALDLIEAARRDVGMGRIDQHTERAIRNAMRALERALAS